MLFDFKSNQNPKTKRGNMPLQYFLGLENIVSYHVRGVCPIRKMVSINNLTVLFANRKSYLGSEGYEFNLVYQDNDIYLENIYSSCVNKRSLNQNKISLYYSYFYYYSIYLLFKYALVIVTQVVYHFVGFLNFKSIFVINQKSFHK